MAKLTFSSRNGLVAGHRDLLRLPFLVFGVRHPGRNRNKPSPGLASFGKTESLVRCSAGFKFELIDQTKVSKILLVLTFY